MDRPYNDGPPDLAPDCGVCNAPGVWLVDPERTPPGWHAICAADPVHWTRPGRRLTDAELAQRNEV